jgi:hypothetical protein
MILPPNTAGPTFILNIVGLLLIPLTYRILDSYFERPVPLIGAFIISIHPTFVFHSVVAYGPEITSLVFLAFGFALLSRRVDSNQINYLLIGIIVGLIDAIWFANFYIACLSIPFFIALSHSSDRRSLSFTFVLFVLAMLARQFYLSPALFAAIWIFIAVLFLVILRHYPNPTISSVGPMLLGIFSMIVLWRGATQIAVGQGSQYTAGLSLANALFAIPDIEIILRFLHFIVFHMTVLLFIMLLLVFALARDHRPTRVFFIVGLVGAIGTLKVFGMFGKDVLLQIYLFSDSRFFLFITFVWILALGLPLGIVYEQCRRGVQLRIGTSPMRTTKICALIIASALVITSMPSYVAIPYGVESVNIEERYGWRDLQQLLEGVGNHDSIFLLDRAREFSWITGRKSAMLTLSSTNLTDFSASVEILQQAIDFDAAYLLMDSYTSTRWNTFEFLQYGRILANDRVILNAIGMNIDPLGNSTGPVDSLTLILETSPNTYGRISRVFSLGFTNFIRRESIDFLAEGWDLTNAGTFSNESEGVRIVIGDSNNTTSTWRPEGYDLALSLTEAFLLFDIEEVNAELQKISLWSSDGTIIGYANEIGEGLFIAYVGSTTVGDIQINVDGLSGASLVLKSVSVWNPEN